jgi:hypothetical protein
MFYCRDLIDVHKIDGVRCAVGLWTGELLLVGWEMVSWPLQLQEINTSL